jgi:hypothetical protein
MDTPSPNDTPAPIAPVPPSVPPPSTPPRVMTPAIIGIGVVMLLLVLGIGFAGISGIKYLIQSAKKSTSSPTPEKQTMTIPSKYTADSDSDYIPDVLENELGYNKDISEITRCKPASCGSSDPSQALNTKNNILLILDSSGSMDIKIGGKTKMELAKEAIRSFLGTTAANVSVGIMEYGHKGSNAASSKALSCASADIVAPIGSVTTTSVDSYLSQIKPVGWTPIGLAIRKGKEAFIGKGGQKNQIIVVTDGVETCDTNPSGAAAEVKSSPFEIRVDVIGFAVNASEQSSLQAISTSGGGLFSVASNVDQLVSQMRANHENFEKFQAGAKCASDVYQKSVTCLEDVRQKTNSYISTALSGKTGSDYTELNNMRSNIFTQYSNVIDTIQTEWSNANKANMQKLIK